jgi:hypothetical protein
MSGDTTLTVRTPLRRCRYCGYYVAPSETHCPNCQQPIEPPANVYPETLEITRRPHLPPAGAGDPTPLSASAEVLLQVLPSGVCIKRELSGPLILGRGDQPDVIDLTDFKAMQHGVSRRHCVLQPEGDHLTVTDLDSSNGTYLNDQRLVPHQPCFLTDSDRLILGTLHLILSFGVSENR